MTTQTPLPHHYQIPAVNRELLKKNMLTNRWEVKGRVIDVVGTVIEANLPRSQKGSIVEIQLRNGEQKPLLAEVVGFRDDRVLLLPFSDMGGISPGSIVSRQSTLDSVPVGDFLLGQVIDPFLNVLSNSTLEIPQNCESMYLDRQAPNPMQRRRIHKSLGLGVRAIDGLLTLGDGQRIGILAGSGVGKSVLMGMMAKGSEADINVIGLIGERGREVREFLEKDLGEEGLRRSVVVVVTGDQSPLMKIRAAKAATAIAEFFSAQGKSVLLMLDSLTRVAMAQREIGLAIGEPPTTKGYTPSVFSLLPRILERSGPQAEGHGAISALYTVLVDGDDFNDPIADAARSVLDGHIVLSRRLAAKGQYPAIDVGASVSRVMVDVVGDEHQKAANYIRSLLGAYEENFDLVQIGAYQPGTNPQLDEALRLMPKIEKFLKQDLRERSSFRESILNLLDLAAQR